MKRVDNQVTKTISNLVHFLKQRGYEPGERLPSERTLAERFEVTRAVIREALMSLELMRYIQRRPNSGIFMRAEDEAETSIEALVMYSNIGMPFGHDTDLQCLEVRRLLEVQAVRIACDRRTDEDLAELTRITEVAAHSTGDGSELSKLDYDFHMQIFEATQNKVLVQLVTPFYLMSEMRRERFFRNNENFLNSHQQHLQLIDAIRARDTKAAAGLMDQHIGNVESYFGASEDVEEFAD